jgi:hypothetical protein
MIERRTASGGRIALDDPPAGAMVTCGGCGRMREGDARPFMLSVETDAPGKPEPLRLDTSICPDCLSEALAILFGRRAVQRGEVGLDMTQVADLADAGGVSTDEMLDATGAREALREVGDDDEPEP